MLIHHLYQLGHRHLAFFRGHPDSLDSNERWDGLLKAMAEFGLSVDPSLTIQLDRHNEAHLGGTEEGQQAARLLLKRKAKFTALVAFNDIAAVGAVHAFQQAGLRVHEDVSVVGFDDIALATLTVPGLTTIRQPLEQMGEMAAQNLLRQIDEKVIPPLTTLIKPQLIVRQSTGPAVPR